MKQCIFDTRSPWSLVRSPALAHALPRRCCFSLSGRLPVLAHVLLQVRKHSQRDHVSICNPHHKSSTLKYVKQVLQSQEPACSLQAHLYLLHNLLGRIPAPSPSTSTTQEPNLPTSLGNWPWETAVCCVAQTREEILPQISCWHKVLVKPAPNAHEGDDQGAQCELAAVKPWGAASTTAAPQRAQASQKAKQKKEWNAWMHRRGHRFRNAIAAGFAAPACSLLQSFISPAMCNI